MVNYKFSPYPFHYMYFVIGMMNYLIVVRRPILVQEHFKINMFLLK